MGGIRFPVLLHAAIDGGQVMVGVFARKTENRDMAAFAAADYMAGLPGSLTLPNENNLYYRLQKSTRNDGSDTA